jgi:hypothetical protein
MHRGRYKPGGNPRPAAVLPRGLIIGPALNSPWQGDAISGRVPMTKGAFGGGMGDFAFAPTAYGVGARLQWTLHDYASNIANNTQPFTVDCLFLQVGAVNGRDILQVRGRSSGNNGTLQTVGTPKVFRWTWNNGSARTLDGTTEVVAGGIYHVAVTNDRVAGNETTRLYVNGVLEASAAYAGAMQSLDQPMLRLGSTSSDNVTYILMAAVATAAWSAEEVAARSRDPYSHLSWDEPDLAAGWWGAGGTTFNTFNDTITDALTAAESLVAAVTFGAELADSWALAESFAAATTFEAPLTDATSTSDSLVCVVTVEAPFSDSVSAAEEFAAALSIPTEFSDALTAADSLAYTLVFGAALTDSVSAAESFGVAASFAASMSETMTIAEASTGGLVYTTTLSDGGAVGDSFGDSLTVFAQAPFTMLQVAIVVGRIEFVSGGPEATFTNLTEQQSRV